METAHGEILRINLNRKEIKEDNIKDLKKYPGGKALGYYLISKTVPPGTVPFSERNKIAFVPGALSGLAPGASKVAVVSISPETGYIVDSYAGDRFGPFVKRWGYDAILIEGKADEMVYIEVGENIKIIDAPELKELGVYETTNQLWLKHGDGAVAAIGPAGENKVRFANIMFDTERAAGRGGLGAVLGSKNVKAIFVKPISIENMKVKINGRRWNEKRSELYEALGERASPSLKKYGTTNGLSYSGKVGMSPGFNFSRPYLPEELTMKLSGEEVKKYEIEPERFIHGKSCPVKCARYVEIEYEDEKFKVKPEYESIGMLGAATGIFDFPKVGHLIHLSNDLSLDAIAAGNVIGWLFELVERGEIGMEEVGFEIDGFGDYQGEKKLLFHIAHRMGIGAVLAEGVKRASEILNRGKDIAVHVKGLEAPAWDPRGLRTYALSYATADVGASHLRGWPSPHSLPNNGPAKELVRSMIENRDKDALFDTMGLCKFVPYEIENIEEIYREVYGKIGDMSNIGWRVESLARSYDIASGMNPVEEDIIPDRWWEEEEDGPAKGNRAFRDFEDFIDARNEFYRLRGWSREGIPQETTLKKLGLEEFLNMAHPFLERVS